MKQQQDRILREIEEIAERIAASYRPEKIILFGSCARGFYDKHSDIDLFIIKDTEKPRHERAFEVAKLLDHTVAVDVVVYTPREVEDRLAMGDFFLEDVFNEGRVLYERHDP